MVTIIERVWAIAHGRCVNGYSSPESGKLIFFCGTSKDFCPHNLGVECVVTIAKKSCLKCCFIALRSVKLEEAYKQISLRVLGWP